MGEEKSEAQIRNEEEVHQIMMERGYSSASNNKKQVKEVFGNDFSFGPIISGVIGIGLIFGGWVFLQNYIFKNKKTDNSSYNNVSSYSSSVKSVEENEELKELQTCLKTIDMSEIAAGDSEFWNKYISRYEQMIACYEKHPSVVGSSEKAELQERLAEARTQSDRYRNNMSKIDSELAKNLADIKARSKDWDEELARRQRETQAQKEALDAKNAERKKKQDEHEAQQQVQKEAEERAKQEKETRCAAYAGKTKEELADNDSDVKNAKNTYNQASSNYSSVYRSNAAAYSNVVLTAEQRAIANEKIAEAKNKMDAAQLNYNNVRNSKLSYYSQILNSCK